MPEPSPSSTDGHDSGDTPLLASLSGPQDLKALPAARLPELAAEIRHAICEQVSQTGVHLAPNLGVVELTIALH